MKNKKKKWSLMFLNISIVLIITVPYSFALYTVLFTYWMHCRSWISKPEGHPRCIGGTPGLLFLSDKDQYLAHLLGVSRYRARTWHTSWGSPGSTSIPGTPPGGLQVKGQYLTHLLWGLQVGAVPGTPPGGLRSPVRSSTWHTSWGSPGRTIIRHTSWGSPGRSST